MNKTFSISAGILAGAALLFAAAPAMARVDVDLNIGLPGGPVYVQQQPVYVEARPVYVQPRPYYVEERHHQHRRHHHKRHDNHYVAPRHDRDGDGVPNRYDRRPNNPYRY